MANEIKFFLDGQEVEAQPGETILEVARRHGKRIPTLCHDPRLEPFTSCFVCLVEQEGRPGFVPSCGTKVAPGLKIQTDTPAVREARRMALELLMSAHAGDCVAPCRLQCPDNIDIQTYIAAIAAGEFGEALQVIKRTNPFPSVCGRVCPHTCELQCRRNRVDEPVAINPLKRFVADLDRESKAPYRPPVAPDTGFKVAVIGGGPAGLTAAYYLRQKGHAVVVFEMNEKAGGMLRYGIPRYRLPHDVLDAEIAHITDLGVELRCGQKLGRDFTLKSLREQGFGAVFLAVGAWVSQKMDVPGEDLAGVFPGIGYLFESAHGRKPKIGKQVIVVGGGNTAIDAARTARRMGAEVTLLYRRTRKEMPAETFEVEEAEREGVKMHFLAAPVEVLGKSGKVSGIRSIRMELGEPDASGRRRPVPVPGSEFDIPASAVIAAIGQKPDLTAWGEPGGPAATKWATVKADEKTYQSEVEWIFTAGDCLTGAATAIEAIAGGRKAAISIDRFLRGLRPLPIGKPFSDSIGRLEDVPEDIFQGVEKQARAKGREMPVERRLKSFKEVELGISAAQALAESARCLECGCTAVDTCQFRNLCEEYEARPDRFKSDHTFLPVLEDHPFIRYDPNKCIMCGRCVRICLEQQGTGALGFVRRGFETQIQPTLGQPLLSTDCDACGQCLGTCPTGALEVKPVLPKPGPFQPTCHEVACGFCGVACRLKIESVRGHYLRALSQPGIGHNRGNLCVDGSFGHRFLETLPRLKEPRVRSAGKAARADWERALSAAADGLKKRVGRGVAVLSSGPLTNECAFLLQRLAREGLKTPHLGILDGPDEPRRMREALGPATLSFAEIGRADAMWVVGRDPFEHAPVAGIEIRRAALGGVPLWVLSSAATRLDELSARTCRVPASLLGGVVEALARADGGLSQLVAQAGVKEAHLVEVMEALRSAKRPVIIASDDLPATALAALGEIAHKTCGRERILLLRRGGNAVGREELGLMPGDGIGPNNLDMSGIRQALRRGELGALLLVNTDPLGGALAPKDVHRDVFVVAFDVVAGPWARRADVALPATALVEESGSLFSVVGTAVETTAAFAPAGGKALLDALDELSAQFSGLVRLGSAESVWREALSRRPELEKLRPRPAEARESGHACG
ncbi:MAG: FAD-dependent oxidoreductase [Myxococcales bacterium]|nr:FAD-dependent oxidoreductase [Myxococcales bacterium]